MKINEIKHNHSLTDLLKVILFALLMLAPFFAIATRSLYVICNKNANQSYYGETINETNINVANTLQIGTKYYLNYTYDEQTSAFGLTTLYITDFIDETNVFSNPNNLVIDKLTINNTSGTYPSLTIYSEGTAINTKATGNASNGMQLSFILDSYNDNVNLTNFLNTNKLLYKTYNKYSFLDNVFDYSINQLQESNLFNWTQNTLIYRGVNNMCTELNITIQAIPMILTYWLLLTCIYVVIDITIKLFTTLTHMIGNRKA